MIGPPPRTSAPVACTVFIIFYPPCFPAPCEELYHAMNFTPHFNRFFSLSRRLSFYLSKNDMRRHVRLLLKARVFFIIIRSELNIHTAACEYEARDGITREW